MLDKNLRPWWNDKKICGDMEMNEWRAKYVADIKATKEAKKLFEQSRLRIHDA